MCSGLDILKFEQTSLFYSASYLDFGGLELSFGRAKPIKDPSLSTALYGKTSVCFVMQLIRKSTSVTRYVKLSVCEHDRAQSGTTHSGSVYSAS